MLNKLTATVLIVEDLDKCMTFYQDIFGLKSTFTDDVSAGYKLAEQDFVVLQRKAAAEMVGEEALSLAGNRTMMCIEVENVDDSYKSLRAKGLAFLKAPKSQDWGRRTAYFADPEGNIWELWHEEA